ncbi:uncharacterized protein CANTADRAFT_147616 [Suhomyces tanzawaensis NRRL Y-17324]|uniref:Uncharacterized protein n=1 Tax=Suhomyces tanzawaensis NRRL Y-17324 TaxID=984487 RepID=A0A1E4SAT4_9ASCO|nr:uncharacterized protein CANTADRAFT_147616 [Suhomyces tanzawaensis NRRL Y-17324]ODV76611.1 hypothetical protein CANTADRAFT_147616 [Suhomyces tanzawaensis NRRL Y-17324]
MVIETPAPKSSITVTSPWTGSFTTFTTATGTDGVETLIIEVPVSISIQTSSVTLTPSSSRRLPWNSSSIERSSGIDTTSSSSSVLLTTILSSSPSVESSSFISNSIIPSSSLIPSATHSQETSNSAIRPSRSGGDHGIPVSTVDSTTVTLPNSSNASTDSSVTVTLVTSNSSPEQNGNTVTTMVSSNSHPAVSASVYIPSISSYEGWASRPQASKLLLALLPLFAF